MTANTGSQQVLATRIEHDDRRQTVEHLAEEVAVALVYNGISHAVMMCTPLDLEDFALGFSLSEGILDHAGEMHDLEVRDAINGITIDMRIAEPRFLTLKERRRSRTGRTGCGLCGVDSLDAAMRPIARVTANPVISADAVLRAITEMNQHQQLNQRTGAVHGAGYWRNGEMLLREDVGRHNALDKLIGATAREADRDGILCVTSRASYEMVHKAASANFAIIAAVSAPTALAVELANIANMTLIGFARDTRVTVYTHRERIP